MKKVLPIFIALVCILAFAACGKKADHKNHVNALVEVEAARTPTCTVDGKTATMGCTECDYTEGGEVIPALGHDIVREVIKESTDKIEGQEKITCKNCDELEEYRILPVKDGPFTSGGVVIG